MEEIEDVAAMETLDAQYKAEGERRIDMWVPAQEESSMLSRRGCSTCQPSITTQNRFEVLEEEDDYEDRCYYCMDF